VKPKEPGALGTNIFLGIFVIYCIGGAISFPYYNYIYAKDHGFLNWILLGEIVPTAKAAVWPFFAYKHFLPNEGVSPKPKPSINDADAKQIHGTSPIAPVDDGSRESCGSFQSGLEYHQKFSKYMFNKENIPVEEARRLMNQNLSESIKYFSRVRPDQLAAIHSDLPAAFQSKLMVLLAMERTIFLDYDNFMKRPDRKTYFNNYLTLTKDYLDWWNANSPQFKDVP